MDNNIVIIAFYLQGCHSGSRTIVSPSFSNPPAPPFIQAGHFVGNTSSWFSLKIINLVLRVLAVVDFSPLFLTLPVEVTRNKSNRLVFLSLWKSPSRFFSSTETKLPSYSPICPEQRELGLPYWWPRPVKHPCGSLTLLHAESGACPASPNIVILNSPQLFLSHKNNNNNNNICWIMS